MPKIRLSQLLAILVFSALVLLQNSIDLGRVQAYFGFNQPSVTQLDAVPAIPVKSKNWQSIISAGQTSLQTTLESDAVLSTSAKSIYVEDLVSETTLLAVRAEEPLPPASTQKLMTALVALESFSPQTVLTVQNSDIILSNGLALYSGEQLRVEDVLKALLISSSNEAAELLAREYPGGYQAFVERMNQKALEYGMLQTQFRNPTGYDAPGQYMSAKDLHILATQAMNIPLISAIVKEPLLIISDVSGATQHTLVSTNQLLKDDLGAVGIKTGTTVLANEVLVSQFVIDGHLIRVVIMGSTQRYLDTRLVLEWIAKTYTWIKPADLFKAL